MGIVCVGKLKSSDAHEFKLITFFYLEIK